MKLQSKMLLWIGGPFIVIFIAMAAFSYWEASRMIESATQREMKALAEYHAEEINAVVERQRGILEGLGQVWSTALPSDDSFIAAARDFGARADIDGIYLGIPGRDFLYGHERIVPKEEFDPTTRPWYKIALQHDGVQISRVFVNAFHNRKVVALSRALNLTDGTEAVLGMDVPFSIIEEKISVFKIRESGAAFLLDSEGRFIYHSVLTMDNNVHEQGEEAAKRFLSKEPLFFESNYQDVDYYYAVHPVGNTGWSLVLFVPKEEVLADVNALKWTMIAGLLLSLALLSSLLYVIARSIAGPLGNMATAASEVAKGNLGIVPPEMNREDEIGELHNAFLAMVKGLRELIQSAAQTAEQLAAASEQLTASADQSAQGAQHAAEAIVKITGSTIEQRESVDEAFRTVDRITHDINEIASEITGRHHRCLCGNGACTDSHHRGTARAKCRRQGHGCPQSERTGCRRCRDGTL